MHTFNYEATANKYYSSIKPTVDNGLFYFVSSMIIAIYNLFFTKYLILSLIIFVVTSYLIVTVDNSAKREEFAKEEYIEWLEFKNYLKDGNNDMNLLDINTLETYATYAYVIDEYDNFTNTILNEKGEDVYHAITHADGFYRDVFKKFKGTFTRIFMTGVSPVTLDDVTSGFNIGWHISTKKAFNQMLGFSQEDVRKMFTYFKSMGKLAADCNIEWMINDMKPWYDNYCFAEGALNTQSKVFNCDMVVYYLRNYINEGKAPKEMIDRNTRTDYSKMKKLIQLDKLDGNRKSIIKTIAETGEIVAHLEESFSAYQLTDPNIFPSLLFYYGMLTIKGTRGDRMVLGIPNNNVRKQYYDYLKEMFEEKSPIDTSKLDDCFYDMAYEGKWQEGLTFLAESYAKVSSVRDGIEGERNIQGFFMAYLNLCNYYITAPELELNHGFCDFFLLPNLAHYAVKHSYIIELKVLPKKDFSALCEDRKTTKAETQWNEAVAQIHRYAEAPRVKALRQDTLLHKIVMQFEGWELKKIEEVE